MGCMEPRAIWSEKHGQRSLSGDGDQRIGLLEQGVSINSMRAREVSEK
jgi:hypothetical protein